MPDNWQVREIVVQPGKRLSYRATDSPGTPMVGCHATEHGALERRRIEVSE
ncbi:MAG: hypothetical protein WEE36_04790 [Acidimicrobiia bacterium]